MVHARGCWHTVEHTGDLAIQIEAPSLPDLFAAAAAGLAGLLQGEESGPAELAGVEEAGWRELQVEAPEREVLLVDWLRELLYLQMAEGTVLGGTEVREVSESGLRARAGFGSAPVERELKAVTYHDVEVKRHGDGWRARVVFDV